MSRRDFVKSVRPKTFGTQGRARAAKAKVAKVRASWKPTQARAPREEVKFYDTALVGATVLASTNAADGEYDPSATSMISTPAQGDGDQNRDGRQITIKSVVLKATIQRAAVEDTANPAPPEKVFIALVLDTQSNAARMNSEDCFSNLAADARTNVSPLRNLTYNKRFRVLKSEVLDLDVNNIGVEADNLHAWNGMSKTIDWFVPMSGEGLPVQFNTTTPTVNTIASVVDNSLHVIAYSQSATVTLTYNARIRFVG